MRYSPTLRCGEPLIHANPTFRLVIMMNAGALRDGDPLQRFAVALELAQGVALSDEDAARIALGE